MKNQNLQVNNKIRKHGFTLIELLVVIIIMTVLTGIGGGMFVGANEQLQVQKAANNLLITAKYARMTAIEQQTPYKLYIDTENNEFYLATTILDEQNEQVEEMIVQDSFCKPVILEGNVTFEDIQIMSSEYDSGAGTDKLYMLIFFPDGTTQSALIQIGDEKTHYTLSLNAVTARSKLYPTVIEDVPMDTIDLDAENY